MTPLRHTLASFLLDPRAKLTGLSMATLAGIWPLLPQGGLLARADLAHWTALCVAITLGICAGPTGAEPHPQLTPRTSARGRLAKKVAAVLVPAIAAMIYEIGYALLDPAWALWAFLQPAVWALGAVTGRAVDVSDLLSPAAALVSAVTGQPATQLFAIDRDPTVWLGRQPVWPGMELLPRLGALTALLAAFGAACALGADEGRTAWRPATRARPWLKVVSALCVLGYAAALAMAGSIASFEQLPTWAGGGLIAGISLSTARLLGRRPEHVEQRRRCGQRQIDDTGESLAFTLPLLGLVLIEWALEGVVAFEAVAVSAYTALLGLVIWPSPPPVGLSLVLHELRPSGGAAPSRHDGPGADPTPPEGSLRVSPLDMARTGLALPWLVRVEGVERAVEPLAPLWRPEPPQANEHVLGEAQAPAPEGRFAGDQVRVRLAGQADVSPLVEGDSQVRGLALLTPSRLDAPDDGAQSPTWAWQAPAAERRLRRLDAAATEITLYDGTLLLISSGDLTHAYEVELGAPIVGAVSPLDRPVPQLQDHVEP